MTHVSPGGGSVSPPPAWLSRQVLDQEIAHRRARLVALEAEMITACEVAAMGARPGTRATAARSAGIGRHGIATSLPPCGWRRHTARAYAVSARKSASSNG